jgi:glycerol transport system ATP-binding protein
MLEVTDLWLGGPEKETFSHSFSPGEITVILGSNQSGKTNLCRLIAGLNTRARGRVTLNGSDLCDLKPRERPVSLVYQAFVNYPNLSVRDNIASPLRARGIDSAEADQRIEALAGKLQIGDLLDRMPHELSGGQQQRLAIARAMAKDADVLLLDEPLVNLDFKLRESLERELRDLLQESGTVVIYTSSDPRDAFAIGDRLLLLSDGRMVQAGTPLDVYRNPADFTAMELLAEPCVNSFERDGSQCALRPEHVGIGSVKGKLGFEMFVSAYETSGDESIIHGSVDGRDWVVRCRGMHDVSVESALSLHARASDVVSF